MHADASIGASAGSLNRQVLALAVPALGALIAQPLFLLIDAAVVGTLGTAPLAGLGAAGAVFGTVVGLCIFLAYATTASVARRVGAGDWQGAVSQGLDGLVLGVGLGVVLGVITWGASGTLITWLGASAEVAPYAVTYIRIVAVAFPALLASMAGIGVLRGLQNTRATLVVALVAVTANTVLCLWFVLGLGMGVAGSAWATVIAESLAGVLYVLVLIRIARAHAVSLRPTGLGVLATARDGVPLFWRTLVLRAVFLVSVAVAARMGDADLAAYHVSFQVWILLALAADALAIAGQALLGLRLGAGDVSGARVITTRLVWLGLGLGIVLALLVIVLRPWLAGLFSTDPAVVALISAALLVAALQQPIAGPVFALDGVLIGAGDGRWLAGAGTVMFLAFLPAAWWAYHSGAGVVGLWWALTWFMVIRALLLGWRARGDRWLVPGRSR